MILLAYIYPLSSFVQFLAFCSWCSGFVKDMATLEAIKYSRGKLLVLDQLRLPHEHHYDEVSTSEEGFDCIRSMRVRGMQYIDADAFPGSI